MAAGLSIAEVAERKRCSPHTLRFYERAGLLPPVNRGTNGHRRYTEADLEWVDFLLCLRETGMSIAEMKRYVDLTAAGDLTAPKRLAMLEAHAEEVEARIALLQANLEVLSHKIDGYREGIAAFLRARREAARSRPASGDGAEDGTGIG